jgi:hypothetical protein
MLSRLTLHIVVRQPLPKTARSFSSRTIQMSCGLLQRASRRLALTRDTIDSGTRRS